MTKLSLSLLDRQLLLQLSDRLKRLRQEKGIGTVEMANRVGVSRSTLSAVEAGDPGTAIGTYLRVMAVLGVSGELALLAGDALQAAPAGSAAARSKRRKPVVQVLVSADESRHQIQDLQSIALHEEAVRAVQRDPALLDKAKATVQLWLSTKPSSRSASLWEEWQRIIQGRNWRKALGRTRRAQELRQASPLPTVLPEAVRQSVLASVAELKSGVRLGGDLDGEAP